MNTDTVTSFDLEAYTRGFETWDADTVLDLYADDIELIQIDRDNPPSSPKVSHGKDVLRGIIQYGAGAGVTFTADSGVANQQRAAATFTCTFPDGRSVVANAILDIRDGRIVRHHEVAVGDRGPAAS
jgi:ketosteroid isomerase-like protein